MANNPNENNLFMKEADLKKVNKHLNNLNMKKDNDIYDICPKPIKAGAFKLKFHTAFIFN